MTSIEAARGEVDVDSSPAWRVTAAAFTAAVESARLADLAADDLSLARLGEGHADAVAILTELDGPAPGPGSRWGVWAAQPPGRGLTATRAARGWRLTGLKQYCSGARVCTGALVTATAPDGTRLFAVAAGGLAPVPGSWP